MFVCVCISICNAFASTNTPVSDVVRKRGFADTYGSRRPK